MSFQKKIEVTDATKVYGKFKAVDSINFTLEGDGATAYLGPNGAGKTTSFKMMTGLINPTDGVITIGGYDIRRQRKQALSGIGALIEVPEPYAALTVKDSIMFVGELKGIHKKDVEDHIETFGKRIKIPDIDRKIGTLSRGQRARVVFATAFLGDPGIIFLDEPTNGMDPAERIIVRDVILDYKKEHLIFMSSHLLQEVTDTCDDVIFINKGKITLKESTEEVERRYKAKSVRVEFAEEVKLQDVISGLRGMVSEVTPEGKLEFRVAFDGTASTRANILKECMKICDVLTFEDYGSSLEEAFVSLMKED